MKNKYIRIQLIVLALIVLGAQVGYWLGQYVAREDVRNDAINHGVGQYIYYSNNTDHFEWILN